MGKSRKPSRPSVPARAELILKESYLMDATGKTEVPIPELTILGNRAAFRYLARLFTYLAERDDPTPFQIDVGDPDDHVHLESDREPFNKALSDRVELRLGNINSNNRAAVLQKYVISKGTRRSGSLIDRYKQTIKNVRKGKGATSWIAGRGTL